MIEVSVMADGSRQERFGPAAQRFWQGLVTQIRHDVAKMNAWIKPKDAPGLPTMEGKLEINGRQLIPGPYELHVDKPTAPTRKDGYFETPMWLTIQLDIDTESIKIIGRNTPKMQQEMYSRGWSKHVKRFNVIQLHLADDRVYVNGNDSKEMRSEQVSESILSIFRAQPGRRCGTGRRGTRAK